jgi:NAD(P)H-dependent FMN reductase
MNILLISCSASHNSGNYYLLKAIADSWKEQHEVSVFQGLAEFPLFSPARLEEGAPASLQALKQQIKVADLIVLATPEYSHNIPAVLKNLFEWCTASGEFADRNILAITFTPKEPRGEHAMRSLLPTLKTLKANVLAQVPLYKSEMDIQEQKIILPKEIKEALHAFLEIQ